MSYVEDGITCEVAMFPMSSGGGVNADPIGMVYDIDTLSRVAKVALGYGNHEGLFDEIYDDEYEPKNYMTVVHNGADPEVDPRQVYIRGGRALDENDEGKTELCVFGVCGIIWGEEQNDRVAVLARGAMKALVLLLLDMNDATKGGFTVEFSGRELDDAPDHYISYESIISGPHD